MCITLSFGLNLNASSNDLARFEPALMDSLRRESFGSERIITHKLLVM
jgi:hypothetical protein